MSLYNKALLYYNNNKQKETEPKKGLFRRVLDYINNKKFVSDDIDEVLKASESISNDLSTIKEKIESIDTIIEDTIVEDTTVEDNIKESILYKKLNELSKDISKLIFDDNAKYNFCELLSTKMGFDKSAIVVFDHTTEEFIFWTGYNISIASQNKLKFNLKYNDIYKNVSENRHYLIKKGDIGFDEINLILDEEEIKEIDFQLWVPFIFSTRIIAMFVGFKTVSNEIENKEFIEILELFCRLTGALVYNFYQQEIIKKHQERILNTKIEKDDILTESVPTESILPVANIEEEDGIEKDIEISLPDNLKSVGIFIKKYIAEETPDMFAMMRIVIKNITNLKNELLTFNEDNFIKDLESTIKGVLGEGVFISIYNDFDISIVMLSMVTYEEAEELLNMLINDINALLTEIVGINEAMYKSKIVIYEKGETSLIDVLTSLAEL